MVLAVSLTVRGRSEHMARGESPAVARRRLRLALRHAREERGFTQGQVAAALDWSLSKVQRIESGDVTVSRTDLTALLNHLGVTEPRQVDALIADARASRRKGWWDEPRFREHLTPAMMQLLQFESEAACIRVFDPTLIPGLLQTPSYAQFILDFWQDELSESNRAIRHEVRMLRKNYVFGRQDPPRYMLVLDESVLYRDVGGPATMAEQLNRLLEFIREGNVVVRVVSFATAALLTMLNHFIVLDMGGDDGEILYMEAQIEDQIIQAPETVARYQRRFQRLWEASLSEEASERLIQARLATMLSSMDRPSPYRDPLGT